MKELFATYSHTKKNRDEEYKYLYTKANWGQGLWHCYAIFV